MVGRVEILWINRSFPVEGPTAKIVRSPASFRIRRACTNLRPSLRLIGNDAGVQFMPLSISPTHAAASSMSIAVRRFEELIGGHPLRIEVAAVANDRWRARLVRIPGVPTALMPF